MRALLPDPFALRCFKGYTYLQVEKAIERYRDYVANNQQNDKELKAILDVS